MVIRRCTTEKTNRESPDKKAGNSTLKTVGNVDPSGSRSSINTILILHIPVLVLLLKMHKIFQRSLPPASTIELSSQWLTNMEFQARYSPCFVPAALFVLL